MIGEEWRFWAMGGLLTPGGPGCWHVVDWDQRRTISVTLNNDPEDEDSAIEHLRRHIDDLGPDVYAIEISEDGELISVSSNSDDDETLCPHFPPLQDLQLNRVGTVSRSELRELDRLGPNVDLVSYQSRRVVFKYYFHLQFVDKRWDEMNMWMRLSPHPHIVPFDRVVVEELHGQNHIVGFTTLHIAGGTLDAIEENPEDSRVFKLKWLLQLTSVVDDLYYKYGIQHQDIAPRNLLVDEATDNIMLFDFNFSARIGAPVRGMGTRFFEEGDDIKSVIFTAYEIITRDNHFRSVPHRDQDASSVLNMENWVKHPNVRLDQPLAKYRAELDAWVLRRKERGNLKVFTDASDYIDWSEIPEPSRREAYEYAEEMVGNSGQHEDLGDNNMDASGGDESEDQVPEHSQNEQDESVLTTDTYPSWTINRRDARQTNLQVIEWERPAQKTIKEGMWVYADGRVVDPPNQA